MNIQIYKNESVDVSDMDCLELADTEFAITTSINSILHQLDRAEIEQSRDDHWKLNLRSALRTYKRNRTYVRRLIEVMISDNDRVRQEGN